MVSSNRAGDSRSSMSACTSARTLSLLSPATIMRLRITRAFSGTVMTYWSFPLANERTQRLPRMRGCSRSGISSSRATSLAASVAALIPSQGQEAWAAFPVTSILTSDLAHGAERRPIPRRLGHHAVIGLDAGGDQLSRPDRIGLLVHDGGEDNRPAPAIPVLRQRAGGQHGRRYSRLHVGRAEAVEPVAVPARRPGVGRPAFDREYGVDVAVEQERWPGAIFDASDHVRPVALGRLELRLESDRLQPPGDVALHRAFLAGIATDGDQLGGERGRFLGREQTVQPRFSHCRICFPSANEVGRTGLHVQR